MEKATQTPIKRVLCVGLCSIDIVHVAKTYPLPDQNTLCYASYWQRGGHASNVATVLSELGSKCELLAMLSDAKSFEFLIKDLQNCGIIIKDCAYTAKNALCSTVLVVPENETRTIIEAEPEYPELTHSYFRRIKLHDEYYWVHFEARNSEVTLLMMHDIIKFNNENNEYKIQISILFEYVSDELLTLAELADYVFIHKNYAKEMNWQDPNEAVIGMRDEVVKKSNRKQSAIFICRWDTEKTGYLDLDGNYIETPKAPKTEITDTIGVTAAFVGATIYGLLQLQLDIKNGIYIGNLCAAFKLGSRGFTAISGFMHYLKMSKIKKIDDRASAKPAITKEEKVEEVEATKNKENVENPANDENAENPEKAD